MKLLEILPGEDRAVIDELDGWKIRQYFNVKARRWYVTISQNSTLAMKLERHRLLRSHYVYMRRTSVWNIGVGYVIHHHDLDSRNDAFSNLRRLTTAEHDALHMEYSAVYGQPSLWKNRKHSPETIEKMRLVAQARGNNDIWDSPKTHHFERTRELMSKKASGVNNPMFRSDLDVRAINEFYAVSRSLSETAARFGCSVAAIRYRLDRALYASKANPLTGRERTYRFDDAEMIEFYKLNGSKAAAAKYGCKEATIFYRVKAFKKESETSLANQSD